MANPIPPNYITTSSNMGLQIPAAGLTPGPAWFTAIVQSLNIIDQHNHSLGEGVQINSSGISLTAPLSLNNNTITAVQAVTFTPGAFSTLSSIYVNGADLFYNDGNGNTVQLTSGGAVNATSSGISSGTATASFVASVLVVNAATNTPADIRGASIFLGNNVSGSNYVKLSPPNSLGTNYTLTLPLLPSSTSFVTLDTSGNLAASIPTNAVSLPGTLTVAGFTTINNELIVTGGLGANGGLSTSTVAASSFVQAGSPAGNYSQFKGNSSTTGPLGGGGGTANLAFGINSSGLFLVVSTATGASCLLFAGVSNFTTILMQTPAAYYSNAAGSHVYFTLVSSTGTLSVHNGTGSTDSFAITALTVT